MEDAMRAIVVDVERTEECAALSKTLTNAGKKAGLR
jgi:hypothetical protein